jgi:hypothetical protein
MNQQRIATCFLIVLGINLITNLIHTHTHIHKHSLMNRWATPVIGRDIGSIFQPNPFHIFSVQTIIVVVLIVSYVKNSKTDIFDCFM